MASVKMRDAVSHAGVRISVYSLLLPDYRRIGDIESGPIFHSPHILALQQGDAQAPQVGASTAISCISFASSINIYLPDQSIVSDHILLPSQLFLHKSCT